MELRRYLSIGLVGGLACGLIMSMVEMTSELMMGHSFFTPTYMIAAPVVGMGPLETAMRSPGFSYFDPVPVMVGMVGHFMWSALWGALFGAIAYALELADAAAFWGALAYVAVVAAVMSYVVLPLVGLQPLPETSGWLPMVLMHGGYWLGLAVVAVRASGQAAGVAAERRGAAA